MHASSGLAIQVLERADAAKAMLASRPESVKELHRVCDNWNRWFSNPDNFFHPELGEIGFQDDSGV